jgi:hypothetical protein
MALSEKVRKEEDRKLIIAVDFDHTLFNEDKLIPGAKEAMQQLWGDGHYIMIYSCNNKQWIEKLMEKHDIPYHEIYGKEGGKPVCDCYIDDRGIGFTGDWVAATREVYDIENRRDKIKALTP